MLIFDISKKDRIANSQIEIENLDFHFDKKFLRKSELRLPEVSELQVVRHYTKLSKLNFSIDSNFYPLGSCTMKYNPRGVHKAAMLPGFIDKHPMQPDEDSQGFLACLYELQDMLKEITGMEKVALSPMAGAQGEFVGIAMIKAYHQKKQDFNRTEMLVPDAAHGTNPASAAMCGYSVKEIPTGKDGDLDLEALEAAVSEKTAGIMLTNPSTLGVFDRKILKISEIVHKAGGLMYYDGANLNAILGKVRPSDMGFDVMHMNLHKTFATPHGGGGPGCGSVAANHLLAEFLPTPIVEYKDNQYKLNENIDTSIGKVSTFIGNSGILLRAYAYIRMLGKEGLSQVAEMATLNANYLLKKLKELGIEIAYPDRLATHEFLITFKKEAKQLKVTAKDFAKRLLDYQIHAPTTYFPLLVPECWLIEPTETEDLQTLDYFIDTMEKILEESKNNPNILLDAPHTMPIKRLDEVAAAKNLFLKEEN